MLLAVVLLGNSVMVARAETPSGGEMVTGTYLGPGVECPQVMLDTGEQISLAGIPLPDVRIGRTVSIIGQFLRVSTCQQGRAFRVTEVTISETPD